MLTNYADKMLKKIKHVTTAAAAAAADTFLVCLVAIAYSNWLIEYTSCPLTDLGFFRGDDFGNPSERCERALRVSGLTGE